MWQNPTELKRFSDLIDALGKVARDPKAIVNLPKVECETTRRTLDETHRVIDTTFNVVMIRLGDILLHTSEDDFLREAAHLDNYNECMQAEREFRLCRSLRVTLRETGTLATRLTGAVSTKDWNALPEQMQTEGEVALFIGQQFQQLANDARGATRDNQRTAPVRDALTAFRAALIAERQETHQTGTSAFRNRVANRTEGSLQHGQDCLPAEAAHPGREGRGSARWPAASAR